MEVGVHGETTASVHDPVAQGFHSQRDSVIILGMSISFFKILILILIYYSIEVIYTLKENVYRIVPIRDRYYRYVRYNSF